MKSQNTYIFEVTYYGDTVIITFEDKPVNTELITLDDVYTDIIVEQFDELKSDIESEFMDNLDDNEITVLLNFDDVPLVSNIAEIALTTTPVLDKVYAEFHEWIVNNGFNVSKIEF